MTDNQIKTQLLVQGFWQSIVARNFDSEIVVLAIADLLASVAAKLEVSGSNCPLDDRLDCFIDRVRERYPEIVIELLTRRAASRG